MTCKRNGAVTVAWRLLVRYSVRLKRRLNSDRKSFEISVVSTDYSVWWEKGCFAAPWVELLLVQRLLSESQSSSSERRREHGTPKMNSWRFFEGSSTSAIVRRQRSAPGQVMLHQQQLEQAASFLLACQWPKIVQPRTQGDDMRDSNPTFSCCLARVAIPCQVQQPGTAPPSGSKRSFFPLLFLPLLIEEQRWNLEQQISEV